MSVIGKRPAAANSSVATALTDTTSSSFSSASSPPSDPQQNMVSEFNEDEIIVDATGHLKRMDGGEETHDIAGDLFRARTAGRYQERETRDADEAAYRDFLRKEEEAGREFDAAEATAAATPLPDMDVDAYADDVLSEMGPRAQVFSPKDAMSWEDVQKARKKESIFGDENDDPFPVQGDAGGSDDAMPEWFRKEQEARGVQAEDLNNEDDNEAQVEWEREREERQRKADEYFKKRGEGISISDVLGREYFGPMDEPDDYDKNAHSSFDGFKARKELLLGYTELTVEDINNLRDYKVDPVATGVNQYLQNVQSPFSGYGAIFRLEGVVVDLIGLHGKAWKKVAETHDYKILSGDEVKQASLYSPEDAVREVFRWTEDVFTLKEIAHTHHAAFREAFNEWEEANCPVSAALEDSQASDGSSGPPETGPSDEEMLSMYYLSWSKLAKNLDRSAPSKEDVTRGVAGGDWEVALQKIFPPEWKSNNPNEVYDTVVAFDEIMQADYRVLLLKYGIDVDEMDAKEEESLYGLKQPDVNLQDGVKTWLDTLREVEMPCAIVTHLDSSQLDAVLNATGLAEYFPHDKRVSSDSIYSSQRSDLLGAALRVEQRPDKCVVFDNTPLSANEAHEICMKSISFVDHYARYELLTADLSIGYVGDLNLILFTKLFDKRTDLEPALELDADSGLERQQRKIKTAYWDD